MSAETRSHIDNGIWLCASCSVLIDRDEERFSVEALHQMKSDHETLRRIGVTDDRDRDDLVAVGSEIVVVGRITSSGPAFIRVRVTHFVMGASRDLLRFAQNFDRLAQGERFIIINEIGDGGLIESAPIVERSSGAYEIQFRWQEATPRRDASLPIAGVSAQTGRAITGMAVYIQNFERTLSFSYGAWFARINSGSYLSDLYCRFHGSPWFDRLVMLEMIRLSSIPSASPFQAAPSTPFACVNRVNRVAVTSFIAETHTLLLDVAFDLEGIGQWEHNLSVKLSTPEQLARDRTNAKSMREEIERIEAQNRH